MFGWEFRHGPAFAAVLLFGCSAGPASDGLGVGAAKAPAAASTSLRQEEDPSGSDPDPAASDSGPSSLVAVSHPGASRAVEDAADDSLRVLVTGFNDWKELGEPPNLWRCRDNPSCRLLVGAPTIDRPTAHQGPLANLLLGHAKTRAGRSIEWSFGTMPVKWGVAETTPAYASYDVVLHVGLGVYDVLDKIILEDGAFNRRHGADAAGAEAQPSFGADEEILDAPVSSGIASLVRAMHEREFAGYRVEVKRARAENAYLCNETHYVALSKVKASVDAGERLQRAFFIHVPYARDDDFVSLAEGVSGLVLALLE